METNWVYSISVGVVMLEEPLGTTVKDFDLLVRTTSCKAGAIWMIFNITDHSSMVNECVNQAGVNYVPQLYCSVVRSRCNHSWVKRKLCAAHPVLMSRKTLNELPFFSVPNFYQLIITSGNKQGSISVESNTLDWCWVPFHNCASCWCVVAPNPNCVISRTRSN